ncbi:MAG: PAS domain-containing protein [Chitinophagaceae bacterium]|nr:MAG: PAS domain-containing protein [Chitinophagaceae bacterium]
MKNTPIPFAVPGFQYGFDELCKVLVDGAPEAVIAVDRDYRILLANPASGRWLGRQRGQLLQSLLPAQLPAGDHASLLHFIDLAFTDEAGGFANLFELGGRHLLWNVHPLRERDGSIQSVLCRVQDRTDSERERRQLHDLQRMVQEKEMLLQSRAQLAGTLIDANPAVIFVLDRSLRFCAANKTYLQASGRPAAEVIGQEFPVLVPQVRGTALMDAIGRALHGEAQLLEHVPCILRDGDCSVQLTPLSYEGFVYGVLLTAEPMKI